MTTVNRISTIEPKTNWSRGSLELSPCWAKERFDSVSPFQM